MEDAYLQQAAELLLRARTDRQRIDTLPTECRPQSIDDGYAIQDRLAALLPGGVYGWKIGATSVRARELVGVDSPICARLMNPNAYRSPANVSEHFFFMRAVESEFAFTLSADLPKSATPYDANGVAGAIATLHPAIEVSDSRYHDWTQSGGASLIADNANDGAFVLGPAVSDWRSVDLNNHPVVLRNNGEVCAQGGGTEVLDGPLGALAWLANTCAERGDPLRAGQVITTGSCTGVFIAQAGALVSADFGALGVVDCQF